MSLYTKALKHIDMNRVKELREEKIKRKKIAEEIREQIREELRNINSPEFSNWRYDIDEGMTTSGMFNTTLPAQGDVDLEAISSGVMDFASTPGYSESGNSYTFGPRIEGGALGSSLSLNLVDGSKYDTISFDFSAGTVDNLVMITGEPALSTYTLSPTSGRKTITLGAADRHLGLFIAFMTGRGGDDNLPIGTNVVNNLSFQRRTPMNVFVSLDSPEATAFIRTDPVMKGISTEDKKKKLLDMLDASDEYLLKYLGITGSSARPSDITMPNSWEVAGTGPGGEPGYGSANTQRGLRPSAAERDAKNMRYDPKMGVWAPNINLPKQVDAGGDTQIAAMWQGADGKPYSRPNIPANDSRDWPSVFTTPPDPGRKSPVPIKKVKDNKKKPVFAHYEPEGEVLSEKKRLRSPKDITSKIPGYYDDKPAPIGFPMSPPPKTINGYHPDLVDDKKIAKRFNRLDPQSAKAMPATGNPHIDKKVRAAAKKPK